MPDPMIETMQPQAPDCCATKAAHPAAAVIVTGYGVAHLLGEALSSLQSQTFSNWECIVIDDGAPDDVAGAVAPFLADARFRFLATANHGVSAARNRAIRESSAPLIVLLDGDDLLRPDYLATMVPLLDGDDEIRLATCNARIFGAVSKEYTCVSRKQGSGDGVRGSLADVLDRSFNVYIGSTFRRADFDRVGGFDESLTHAEDLDLWIRLLQLGGHAHFVDAVLGDYRVRPGSASANTERMLMGDVKVYQKARASLAANRPELPLIDRLIAENGEALAFEHAIDRVIDGDTRGGLVELGTSRRQVAGSAWALCFLLWRIFPALARPMLLWRRRAHSRGAQQKGLRSILGEGIAT
jgi:glycosyltransferase involved in cell wall biosynthesis